MSVLRDDYERGLVVVVAAEDRPEFEAAIADRAAEELLMTKP